MLQEHDKPWMPSSDKKCSLMELPSRQGGNLVEKTTWQMKGKAIPVVISSWPKRSVKEVVVAAAVVEAERSCKKNVVALAAEAAAMVGAMLVAVAAVGVGP